METDKFLVRGYPQFFVRHDDLEEDGVAEFWQTRKTTQVLRSYGVSVLQSTVIAANSTLYTVTEKVSGKPLQEVLADANPTVIGETDLLFAGLTRYLKNQFIYRQPIPIDIYNVQQYMLGTTARHPDPHLWLVDLPIYLDLVQPNFTELSDGIIRAEHAIQKPLAQAREAFKDAMTTLDASSMASDRQLGQIVREAITDSTLLYSPENEATTSDLLDTLYPYGLRFNSQ